MKRRGNGVKMRGIWGFEIKQECGLLLSDVSMACCNESHGDTSCDRWLPQGLI